VEVKTRSSRRKKPGGRETSKNSLKKRNCWIAASSGHGCWAGM